MTGGHKTVTGWPAGARIGGRVTGCGGRLSACLSDPARTGVLEFQRENAESARPGDKRDSSSVKPGSSFRPAGQFVTTLCPAEIGCRVKIGHVKRPCITGLTDRMTGRTRQRPKGHKFLDPISMGAGKNKSGRLDVDGVTNVLSLFKGINALASTSRCQAVSADIIFFAGPLEIWSKSLWPFGRSLEFQQSAAPSTSPSATIQSPAERQQAPSLFRADRGSPFRVRRARTRARAGQPTTERNPR